MNSGKQCRAVNFMDINNCNVYFTILINILYLHLSMVKNSYIVGNVIHKMIDL